MLKIEISLKKMIVIYVMRIRFYTTGVFSGTLLYLHVSIFFNDLINVKAYYSLCRRT